MPPILIEPTPARKFWLLPLIWTCYCMQAAITFPLISTFPYFVEYQPFRDGPLIILGGGCRAEILISLFFLQPYAAHTFFPGDPLEWFFFWGGSQRLFFISWTTSAYFFSSATCLLLFFLSLGTCYFPPRHRPLNFSPTFAWPLHRIINGSALTLQCCELKGPPFVFATLFVCSISFLQMLTAVWNYRNNPHSSGCQSEVHLNSFIHLILHFFANTCAACLETRWDSSRKSFPWQITKDSKLSPSWHIVITITSF